MLVLSMSTVAGCTFGDSAAPAPPGLGTESRSTTAPVDSRVLDFDFDDLGALSKTRVGSGALTLVNGGSAPLTVLVASASGGTMRAVAGRDGGYAARFPAYRPVTKQRVVLSVTSPSVTDPLGPGRSDFGFGADFAVDNLTEGRGLDDGNNLIQRGLTGDSSQYKLQIDRNRVSCLVAGDAGEVFVETRQLIKSHTWYRAACRRTGAVVTLDLTSFGGPAERAVGSGDTGDVYLPASTPLVLAGKATSRGAAVVGDSDQFNGALDNVFLEIDRS
jgi:hypothetical protein